MNLKKIINEKYLIFKIGIILSLISIFFYNFNNEQFFYGQTGFSFIFLIIGFVFAKFCNEHENKNWTEKVTLLTNVLARYFLITLAIYLLILTIFVFFGDYVYLNKVIKTFFSTFIGYSNIYLSRTHNFEFQNIINPFYNSWLISLVIQSIFFLFLSQLFIQKVLKNVFNSILVIISFISLIFFFQFDITYYWNYFNFHTRLHEFLIGYVCFKYINNNKINIRLKKYILTLILLFSLSLIIYNFNFYTLTIFVICVGIFFCFICNKAILVQSSFIYEQFFKLYLISYPLLYFFTIYYNNKIKFYIIFFILVVLLYSLFLLFFKKEKIQSNSQNLFFKKINFKISLVFIFIFTIINYSKNINYNENKSKDFFDKLSKFNYLSNIYKNYNINSTSYKEYFFKEKKITNCLLINLPTNFEKYYNENCYKNNGNDVLFFVVGDSHATMYAPLFDSLKNSDYFISAQDGGLYIPNMYKVDGIKELEVKNINKSNLKQAQDHLNKNLKLYDSISDRYDKSFFVIITNLVSHIETHNILDENFNILKNNSDIYNKIEDNLSNLISKMNRNSEILIFEPVPKPTLTLSECMVQIEIYGENSDYCDYSYNNYKNKFLKPKTILNNLSLNFKNVNIFRINDLICSNNKCSFFYNSKNRQAFISDMSHITIQTNSLIRDRFVKFLNQIYINDY